MKKQTSERTLPKVLRRLKRYTPLLILSLLCAAGSVFLTLCIPKIVGRIIDRLTGAGSVDFTALSPLFLQLALTAVGVGLLQWVMTALNNRITFQTVRDIRTEAFRRLTKLPLSYLDSHPTGEVVSRMITDVDTFADGLLLGFSQVFTGILTILGTLVFMLQTRWQIALLVVVLTPLSLLIARFIASRTHAMFRKQAEIRGEQTAYIDETVGELKTVKIFGRETACQETFDEVNGRLCDSSLRATFFSSLVNPTTRFVNSVIYAAVALFGALTVIGDTGTSGSFTVGSLTCLLAYVNQYTKPFNEISGVIAEFQNALTSAARIFALTEEPTEIPDDADARVLTAPEGHVSLSDVSFSYVKERPLIEHLNLEVKAGEHVAIGGPTGCGKTTLINLLMRFYDVNDGAVAVEGTDIRHITRHSLRKSYGMVLQDTWLRRGTVRENLLFGRPDATEDEMIRAAKEAHAHGFITRLENGYDTVLGEGGGSLSAGQKQLICIARILLALPSMLILDEATSSIDTRTEMLIQDAFGRLMTGRTCFIVAHRLSTIKNADLILVMKDGHIIEQGSHDELLQKGGFYATLYNSQFVLTEKTPRDEGENE